MVLHLRQQDDVIGGEMRRAPGAGDEVDRLGGVAREDDLVVTGGADEARDIITYTLVGSGRLLGERVNATMDIGIGGLVVVNERLDHLSRLLRGGGVVEIDETAPVDASRQDGKIRTDTRDIK